MKRLAIIGGGISGLACAYRLRDAFDVTLFEAADRLGGHTNTATVRTSEGEIPVDTGFIVFNEANYPLFSALLDEHGVDSDPTTMSFSYRDEASGFEYGGASAGALLARKSNALRPGFWTMLRDIRRFGAMVRRDVAGAHRDSTLGDYLAAAPLSRAFANWYLRPMAGAIWSASSERIGEFPLRALVAFFDNHGMLEPWKAPRWRYVRGGSSRYVEAIARALGDRVRTSAPVDAVERRPEGVRISTPGGTELFDDVILACHSDQALAMLADPTPAERQILSAIPYQRNEAALHTDASLLPRRAAAWSAWNAHSRVDDPERIGVTYHMNTLQRLATKTPVCVTLNTTSAIDPARIQGVYEYDHPVYSAQAFAAQERWAEISGVRGTHYCGAYWGYGFHEDGMRSAMRVVDRLLASASTESAA